MNVFKTFLFICCVMICQSALAVITPPTMTAPIPVSVALYLNDVTHINPQIETADLEVTLTTSWQDKRLSFDPNTPTQFFIGDNASSKLNQIWSPFLRFKHTRGSIVLKSHVLKILNDGNIEYIQRLALSIETDLNMRAFPFDKQHLEIILREFIKIPPNVILNIDRKHEGISPAAYNVEWRINNFESEVNKDNQYSFNLNYQRRPYYYIFKLFVPLIVVVFLSCVVFWLRKEPVINRLRYVLAVFLTIVAFQWIIVRDTPLVSYLTFFDATVLYSYIVLAFIIIGLTVSRRVEESTSSKLHRVERWAFPSIYLIGLILIAAIFLQ